MTKTSFLILKTVIELCKKPKKLSLGDPVLINFLFTLFYCALANIFSVCDPVGM